MYKAFTKTDFIMLFNLPDDYHVDGLLSYGAWDVEKHRTNIKSIMKEMNIDFSVGKLHGFLDHIFEINIGSKRYWFTVMYGSALLSEMIHLACLFGSKKNIHIGSCGGLSPRIDNMDLILPTWTYGNESTTRTYEPKAIDFKYYPDSILSDKLRRNISRNYKVLEGPIITNQSMMGETWEDVKSWSDCGYYGVEMETATVFSVSKHFNVPSAALIYVSDNLIKGQTVGDDSHILEKSKRELVKKDVYKAGILTLIND
jgi:purine-nucleoside phosphorylase